MEKPVPFTTFIHNALIINKRNEGSLIIADPMPMLAQGLEFSDEL